MRKLLAIVSLWIPAAVIAVTWGMWAERLPSDLPTHWGSSGPADAVTSAPVVFGWTLGIATTIALVGTILLIVPLAGVWVQRAIGGVAAASAAFVLGIWLGSAASSLGVADPYSVELGGWLLLTFVLPAYGVIPLLLLPKGHRRPVEVMYTEALTSTPLSSTPNGRYSTRVVSWLFIATAVVMLVVLALLCIPSITGGGAGSLGFAMILLCVAFLLVVALCAFRVTVDERGFRVTSVLLGMPIKRIAPGDIDTVEVTVLEPTQWGGWGYRVMPGRSAIVLRRGPGMVITMRNQNQFAITLEEPEEPASILLGLIESDPSARESHADSA